MKKIIFNILSWIDNNLNHAAWERFVCWLPDCELTFWIWNNTSAKFCNWVIVDLAERWGEDE